MCAFVLLEVFLDDFESVCLRVGSKCYVSSVGILCIWVSATETIVDVRTQGDVMMMSWCMPVGRMFLKWLIAALLCSAHLHQRPPVLFPRTNTLTNSVKTQHWKAPGSFGVFLTSVLLETLSVRELQLAQGGVETPLCHRLLLLHLILYNQSEITGQ